MPLLGSLRDSLSAESFYEDMIKVIDRLPIEEEYRRVRHLLLQKQPQDEPKITDEQLCKVVAACPHLETAVFTGVPDTTDKTVVSLAENAINLQGLDLSGCTQVTDVGIIEITNKSPPLQWIQLNRVVGLTDPSITAIAKTCSRLVELDVSGLPLLTPLSVRDIWSFSRSAHTVITFFHESLTVVQEIEVLTTFQ